MADQGAPDRLTRLGWRGIGATGITVMYGNEMHDDCWLAVTTDPSDGQPAVSIWHGDGPSVRHVAFWMPPASAHALAAALSPADEPSEEVEAAAKAAFWQDDLGGHIKGRWTWDTIPDEGRENYRQMVRAALRGAAESREMRG